MKLIIVSGRSGSGKSTVLNALEDLGYNCIDNLPVGLLPALVEDVLAGSHADQAPLLAVGVDVRNLGGDLTRFPDILASLDSTSVDSEVIFLDATQVTLVKRFSETRRKHPLTNRERGLREALELESQLLRQIADVADLTIDTTHTSPMTLRELVRSRVVRRSRTSLSLLFISFGFKHGVPVDADFVFDVRCLPNPHWDAQLRNLTGRDAPVIRYLQEQPQVGDMFDDISGFLKRWLPQFEANHRSYMTVAIGCTGGQHRSVYLAERLADAFGGSNDNVLVRHREIGH